MELARFVWVWKISVEVLCTPNGRQNGDSMIAEKLKKSGDLQWQPWDLEILSETASFMAKLWALAGPAIFKWGKNLTSPVEKFKHANVTVTKQKHRKKQYFHQCKFFRKTSAFPFWNKKKTQAEYKGKIYGKVTPFFDLLKVSLASTHFAQTSRTEFFCETLDFMKVMFENDWMC